MGAKRFDQLVDAIFPKDAHIFAVRQGDAPDNNTRKLSFGSLMAYIYGRARKDGLGGLPERIDLNGHFYSTVDGGVGSAGAPDALADATGIAQATGYGTVIQKTGGYSVILKKPVPAVTDRIYEIEAEIEQVSVGAGESPTARLGFMSLDSAFGYTDGSPSVVSPLTATFSAGEIKVLRARFSSSAFAAPRSTLAWADPLTSVYLRAFVEGNRKADNTGYTVDSVQRVRRLTVRDITDSVLPGYISFDVQTLTAPQKQQARDNIGAAGSDAFVFNTARGSRKTAAITAGVLNIDLAAGDWWDIDLNANISTINLQNVPASGIIPSFILRFNILGNYTINWASTNVKWPNGTVPAHGSVSGHKSTFTFYSMEGAARLEGFFSGENF